MFPALKELRPFRGGEQERKEKTDSRYLYIRGEKHYERGSCLGLVQVTQAEERGMRSQGRREEREEC